jgi:hypothetical protein
MSEGRRFRVGKNKIEDTHSLLTSLLFCVLLSRDVLRLGSLSVNLARPPGLSHTSSGMPDGLIDPHLQCERHVSTIAHIGEKGVLPDYGAVCRCVATYQTFTLPYGQAIILS